MNIVNLEQTCYACPSQWEGNLENGDEFYVRCRHGYLRVEVNGKTVFEKDVSADGIDGVISFEEVMEYLTPLGYEYV